MEDFVLRLTCSSSLFECHNRMPDRVSPTRNNTTAASGQRLLISATSPKPWQFCNDPLRSFEEVCWQENMRAVGSAQEEGFGIRPGARRCGRKPVAGGHVGPIRGRVPPAGRRR